MSQQLWSTLLFYNPQCQLQLVLCSYLTIFIVVPGKHRTMDFRESLLILTREFSMIDDSSAQCEEALQGDLFSDDNA